MAARILSPGTRAVSSALRGPAGRSSAFSPASCSALAVVAGRRLNSQLPPGVQHGETRASLPREKGKPTPRGQKLVDFDHDRQQEGFGEAVDVSGGAAPYKALFSNFGISFYQQDGSPAKAARKILLHTWLRDNCRCPKCVNPETVQRSFNIFTSPLPTPPPLLVQLEHRGVNITWTHERHESFYDWDFIRRYLEDRRKSRPGSKMRLWGAEIKESPPTVTYAEVMDTEGGMGKMTGLIMEYGLVFVEQTPFDDSIHTKKLLERIGPIRETHYGGFYDFIPDMAKADTAYTNIALAAHTDTTYFTDPAGLQAFHLLSHTPAPGEPDATGGESLLVDGIHASKVLYESNKSHFKQLARRKIAWHASGNEGVTITPGFYPVFKAGFYEKWARKVRWNADDRGVMPLYGPDEDTVEWYAAAAHWEEILRSKELEYRFQLRPGTTVIFNNHRVLHGRSAFTGLRRICGGYINMDDFVSRWRNSNFPRGEVLAQVVG